MFEILATVPFGIAVDSIYRASLELYRRGRLGNWRDDPDLDPDASLAGPLDASTATGAQVTGSVLGEIERAEGKALRELSDEVAGRYIRRLDEILMNRSRSRPDRDPERGKALLEELRRDYGEGYRHSAAA